MSLTDASDGDQRSVAESLRGVGVAVALTKSGQLLRIDFRQAASLGTDDTIHAIAHSTKLKELHLDGTSITPACVDDLLTMTSLVVLDVQNTMLGDPAMERLVQLPSLRIFLVRGSRASAECVRALRRHKTKIRIVG